MKWLAPVVVFVLSLPVTQADTWKTFEKCTLVEDAYFDGDSFHVKAPTGYSYIFRLYGVDCPETETRIPKRVAEQEKEFGVTEKELLKWGAKAKAFTRKFLSKPFTVHTKKEDAGGKSEKKRYFCVIVDAHDKRLDEALVEAGLARVYGMGADWPERVKKEDFLGKLHPLESKAKRDKVGIWGK